MKAEVGQQFLGKINGVFSYSSDCYYRTVNLLEGMEKHFKIVIEDFDFSRDFVIAVQRSLIESHSVNPDIIEDKLRASFMKVDKFEDIVFECGRNSYRFKEINLKIKNKQYNFLKEG